jgi:hypothetical protein
MIAWLLPVVLALPVVGPAADASTLAIRSERGIDLNGDGYFECLALEVEARVPKPGTYLIYPALGQDRKAINEYPFVLGMSEDQFTAWKEGREEDLSRNAANAFDNMGTMSARTTSRRLRFKLYFNGEQLRDLEADGPWTLGTRLLLRDNLDPETEEPRPGTEVVELEPQGRTKTWQRHSFGRLAAYGIGVNWELTPDSTAVQMHIGLEVHRPDTMRIHVTAAYDDCAADSTIAASFRPGQSALDVRLAPQSTDGRPTMPMTSARVRLRIQGLSFSQPDNRVRGWDRAHGLWEVGPWKHGPGWLYR